MATSREFLLAGQARARQRVVTLERELAEQTGHPVLCTGDHFAATDIPVVRPRPGPAGS
jgi:hypothetical protein